jgi:hypothetical protein
LILNCKITNAGEAGTGREEVMPFDGIISPAAHVAAVEVAAQVRETAAEETKRRRAERLAKDRARMLAAAEPYIQADRTDPFARARAATHIANGVASIRREGNFDLEISAGPAHYRADRSMTMRKVAMRGEIVDVPTVVYTNMARP